MKADSPDSGNNSVNGPPKSLILPYQCQPEKGLQQAAVPHPGCKSASEIIRRVETNDETDDRHIKGKGQKRKNEVSFYVTI